MEAIHNGINGSGYGSYSTASGDNQLHGNIIAGNGQVHGGNGINLNSGSTNNLIYNNYFNNTDNTRISADSTGTTWNVTPVAGRNIVGGPYIGGNYWANPAHTGWSETHPDIGDVFTEQFNVTDDLSNIDRHPLRTQ